jgi:hypothetical protein
VAKELIEKSPTALKPYTNLYLTVQMQRNFSGDYPKDQASEEQAFRNDLVTAGIATLHTAPWAGVPGTWAPGITYTLSATPQEGVKLEGDLPYQTMSIALAKPTVEEVTGIRQEGTDAVVEVTLKNTPSHLYQKLSDVAKNEVSICGHTASDRVPDYCIGWLTPDKLTSETKVEFQFSRFDDGWRVTQ